MKNTQKACMIGLILFAAAGSAHGAICSTDLDGSGDVGFSDLLQLLAEWGPCPRGIGCAADFDLSGEIGFADLLLLLSDWGPCAFDYGEPFEDSEAEQIGLEMLGSGGPLLLPVAIYDRVDRDLDLIRREVPALAGQTHSLAWAPSQLIVQVNEDAPQDEFDALNEYYQVTEVEHLFSNWFLLWFPANFNVPAMVQIYEAVDAVILAEPNGFFGGSNFWEPTDMGDGDWLWNIDDGWHDCFDGCDCHLIYQILVTAEGEVTVLSVTPIKGPFCSSPI